MTPADGMGQCLNVDPVYDLFAGGCCVHASPSLARTSKELCDARHASIAMSRNSVTALMLLTLAPYSCDPFAPKSVPVLGALVPLELYKNK